MCLSHPTPYTLGMGAQFHYHSLSPCIKDDAQFAQKAETCTEVHDCKTEPLIYAISGYEKYKELTPIGIIKDGSIMYGPYKDDGETWKPCEVDICNGAVVNGYYAYAAT